MLFCNAVLGNCNAFCMFFCDDAVTIRLLGNVCFICFLCNVLFVLQSLLGYVFLWFISFLAILLFSGFQGIFMIVKICIMVDLTKLVYFS